jgi:TfoX/Sxy family transcriptional regulator of competence genes
MTAKKTTKEPNDSEVDPRFLPVVNAFAKKRNVSHGKMMSSYGLKVHGKIFAMFGRSKFTVKLPKERVDELVAGGKGERFDPGHGRLMKEWVTVKFGTENWVELANQAYEFVKLRRIALNERE